MVDFKQSLKKKQSISRHEQLGSLQFDISHSFREDMPSTIEAKALNQTGTFEAKEFIRTIETTLTD